MSLDTLLREIRETYLDEIGSKGGVLKEFQDAAIKFSHEHPEEIVADRAIALACIPIWEKTNSKKKNDPDQMWISGLPVRDEFTVYDPDREPWETNKFRVVKRKHATVQSALDQADISARKSIEMSAAANEDMRFGNEALRKARGNRAALLEDLKDDIPKAAE